MFFERENGLFFLGVDDIGLCDRLEVDMFVGVLIGVDLCEEFFLFWLLCLLRYGGGVLDFLF